MSEFLAKKLIDFTLGDALLVVGIYIGVMLVVEGFMVIFGDGQ